MLTSFKVNRTLPTATSDGINSVTRGGRYGEMATNQVLANRLGLADEGAYYQAQNPTPGTGITASIQTAFAATNALLTLRNSDTPTTGKRIYPDFIRLIPVTVPASATRVEALVSIDSITRYSSGGSAITGLVNSNMDLSNAAIGVLHFGALTLAAESVNVRRFSRFQLRAAIPVQFEEYLILFNDADLGSGAQALGGTTAQRNVVNAGSCVIGGGHSMQLHVWYPGNATTAGVWEFQVGWIQR